MHLLVKLQRRNQALRPIEFLVVPHELHLRQRVETIGSPLDERSLGSNIVDALSERESHVVRLQRVRARIRPRVPRRLVRHRHVPVSVFLDVIPQTRDDLLIKHPILAVPRKRLPSRLADGVQRLHPLLAPLHEVSSVANPIHSISELHSRDRRRRVARDDVRARHVQVSSLGVKRAQRRQHLLLEHHARARRLGLARVVADRASRVVDRASPSGVSRVARGARSHRDAATTDREFERAREDSIAPRRARDPRRRAARHRAREHRARYPAARATREDARARGDAGERVEASGHRDRTLARDARARGAPRARARRARIVRE